MDCYYSFSFEDKHRSIERLPIDVLSEFFEAGLITDKLEFLQLLKADTLFVPSGKKLCSHLRNDNVYEIYFVEHHGDQAFRENLKRAQIWIKFLIETGSYVDLDDPAWNYLTVYQVQNDRYKFAGLLSYYPFNHEANRRRLRISQLIVLPPYQKQGLGLKLLEEFYKKALEDEKCFEITVESPSEQFQIVRDVKDILYIKDLGYFAHLDSLKKFTVPNDFHSYIAQFKMDKIEEIHKKTKIRKQQILRCFDISLLLCLDLTDPLMGTAFSSYQKRKIMKKQEAQIFSSQNTTKHIEFEGELEDFDLDQFTAPNSNRNHLL